MKLYVPLLERRAKLGYVSRRQIPALEALARHRVPSVASAPVTSSAKRTQGGDGPQCASVKGLSPVMYERVGADLVNNREGHINRVKRQDSGELTGVRDRGTSSRQSRELGRSRAVLPIGG